MDKLIEKINNYIFKGEETTLVMSKLIITFIIFFIAGFLAMVFKRIIKSILEKYNKYNVENKKLTSIASIISNLIKYIIYIIAVLIVLNMFGVNTASLIATAGIGGVVIAFGVQSIVKDFFNGIFILFDNQYNIGDDVTINGISGEVAEINLRNTIIRGYDGSANIISHGSITTVTNKSKGSQRTMVDIFVPMDTDIEKLKEIITKYSFDFEKNTETVTQTPKYFGVTGTGAHYYKISICLWSKPSKQWENEKFYREGVLNKLKEENIKFLKFDLSGDTNV